MYQLPFGRGHALLSHGWGSRIAGGWSINGNLSRFSGLPFGVGTSSNLNAGGQGADTANQINPTVAIIGGHDPSHPYYDGSAFARERGLGNDGSQHPARTRPFQPQPE